MFRIAVVAHTARTEQAHRLAEQVGADHVSMDDGTLGCTANHLSAWRWLADSPELFGVVLEDDALPVEGFSDQLAMALAVAPEPVVSLYLGTGHPIAMQDRIRKVIDTDAHWLTAYTVNHAVALAIKTSLIRDMLGRINIRSEIDQGITKVIRNRSMCAYSLPSLVDHDDGPSLARHPHRPRPRRAWRTGTRDEWNNSSVRM